MMDIDIEPEPEPEPETSMGRYALYECVPPELVTRIDDFLSFEDSCNFQVTDFAPLIGKK